MTETKEINWAAIRNQFEAGIPAYWLAEAHGIRANTIRVRAHREGWTLRVLPEMDAPPIDIPIAKERPNNGRRGGAEEKLA